ncbi:CLUMA_CG001697, isoform A [Clunio marinus]|uniref:CLUMA_CG001697, isoform A n=1 Tax=Clunio marinus TaxID=568069 RepID=A0A1J1HN66_9DIPT|nr:CLUMA_CG001697, isoform A [Clunio marinus]
MNTRASSSKSSGGPPRRSRSPLEDLIKCFCGACESFFKRKHIIQALKANEYEVLSDNELRKILKKFIEFRQGGSYIKPPIMEIVECYELSESILAMEEDLEERRADIDDLCFTEDWEDRLAAAIDDGTTDDFFNELMIECSRRLGEEPEYTMFKEELRKKLK